METIDLNELKERAYKCACNHGFHDEELSDEHFLALVITELSEAIEADRNGVKDRTELFKKRLEHSVTYNGPDKKESNKLFCSLYEADIRGTVAEELADTFIRLLDLFGLKNRFLDESGFDEETIQDYSETYKDKSFAESIFYIEEQLIKNKHEITSCVFPEIILLEILGFAEHLGIDLFYYIKLKIQYNESRPYRHGKKY